MKIALLFALLIIAAPVIRAQTSSSSQPISDNSFLIEEAYNQEKGVIQYINTFSRTQSGDFAYTFTNEYPVGGQRHQLSYTVQFLRTDRRLGLGDTFINYRYQLHGMKKEDKVAISPRATLILPTGNYRHAEGTGALGYQFNLPVSVIHSKLIVTHWNAGVTLIPHAKDPLGEKADLTAYNLGQSTVFLIKPNFNFLVETFWTRSDTIVGPHHTTPSYALLINPGIRWAYNYKNGLQIVPGIAAPIGAGPSYHQRSIYLYLSFEK